MPGLEAIPAWGIAWIVAVMLISGFVHGVIGFGFSIIATPLLGVATLFFGERIRRRTSTAVYQGWLRKFLWVMVVLLVFQFLRMMWERP